MVFQWRGSLVSAFRFYAGNAKGLVVISVMLSLAQIGFITLFHHGLQIIDVYPVFMLALLFMLQFVLLMGVMRLYHASISYAMDLINTGKASIINSLRATSGRFLRGLKSNFTVFMVLSVPLAAYFLTLKHIESLLLRAVISTVLLGVIFYLAGSYQFVQLSAAIESKVVNDLRISTTITGMYFAQTLITALGLAYFISIPVHIMMIDTCGHVHFCGCSMNVLILTGILTFIRPLRVLMQVQIYSFVKKAHFPVPEMDPDLRDRNLI